MPDCGRHISVQPRFIRKHMTFSRINLTFPMICDNLMTLTCRRVSKRHLLMYQQAFEDTSVNASFHFPGTQARSFILFYREESIMAWVYLIIAGGLEVFWSTCMKFSNGFTVAKFTVLTIIGMVFSFLLLSQATKVLPLGTAYGIWTGIGAVGAVIVGIFIFKEPVTAARIFFIVLLLTGIVGLKATSGH